MLQLTHVRLDREGITRISNLDCLGPVTNLYLQQVSLHSLGNIIEKLSSMKMLGKFRYGSVLCLLDENMFLNYPLHLDPIEGQIKEK